ncbi:MAG TPA: CHRD domain-containing protein [Flavisolibacter sp.]
MKQFYSTLRHLKPAKTLLLSAFFSCAFYLAGGQTYYTTLSGPNEEPPNASPGTGKAVLTISGNFMTLQTSFSGLLGTTTASHIHAPTPVAGAGTAPVATQTPSFVGFPVGVTAGSYTQTFDMTMASSYRPGYITANGGTPAGAFAALKTALNEGKAYLNIHTALFPGGEIRGFFTLCPTIMVTIPNAFALPQGVLPNTVYPAYAPASSLMLTANASGGTGPYSYSWSNGSSAQTLTVSPTSATPYTVTVRDQNGCPGTASTMVNVVDVSGGKKDNKIVVCHNGNNSLTIAAPAVSAHLNHGDMLGSCGQSATTRRIRTEQAAESFSVQVRSNPSASHFELQLSGDTGNTLQVRVMDQLGRVVETRNAVQANQILRIGMSFNPGIYLVQIVQGEKMQTLRLLKTR